MNRTRWPAHPLFTVSMTAVWLLLVNTLSFAHLLLGVALAIAIPALTARFWPDRVGLRRPRVAMRLAAVVLYDIVVANVQVARLILAPRLKVQPRFVQLPLDVKNPYARTLLAGIITMTPGTVSVDVSARGDHLLIHGLDVRDQAELIRSIKQRYERPLLEILE